MATTAATAKAVRIIREPPRYLVSPLETRLLVKLIFGHGLDVSFMAGQSAVTRVFRFCIDFVKLLKEICLIGAKRGALVAGFVSSFEAYHFKQMVNTFGNTGVF